MAVTSLKEESVAERLKANFGDVLSWAYVKPRRLRVLVERNRLSDVALYLKNELGFDHVASVSGVDYPGENVFEVVYHATSYSDETLRSIIFALVTRMPRNDPTIDSLTGVWKSAEYHERETFEMFGIIFKGHPKLERLLLPEDWRDIPPLRKDFRLYGR